MREPVIDKNNGWRSVVSVASIEIGKYISILFGLSVFGIFLISNMFNYNFIDLLIFISLFTMVLLLIFILWFNMLYKNSIIKNYRQKNINASILYHEHNDKIFLEYLRDNNIMGSMPNIGKIEIAYNDCKYRVSFFSRFAFSIIPQVVITPDKHYTQEQKQIFDLANIIDQFFNYFDNNTESLFKRIMFISDK